MTAMTGHAGARGPLPPHRVYRNFLDRQEHAALLDWALASEHLLAPSIVVGEGGRMYPIASRRSSRSLHVPSKLGPWKDIVRRRIEQAMPEIFGGAGLKPFAVSRMELELVVYNDGARFLPHYDTFRDGAAHSDRLLTGVYYFHAEPRGFSGGALRLYRFGATDGAPGDYVDIEPEQNALLVFPSWATHEVRTVHCPSGRYGDSRFAMNCWLERARPVTS